LVIAGGTGFSRFTPEVQVFACLGGVIW